MTNSNYYGLAVKKSEAPYVVLENDFSTGLEGWSGLLKSGVNYYPSLHPASLTGPYSMVIDTRGGTANVEASATKRLPYYKGYWKIFARVAWNSRELGSVGKDSLDKLRIALDWQDETNRHWWEVQYLHYSEGTSSHYPRWRVSNGNAATMNLVTDLSQASAGDGKGHELGYNAINKFDFHEIEIGLTTGVGARNEPQWHYLMVDGVRADISSLDATTSQSNETEFQNGANLLFLLENRPTEANADPYMLVDYVRVEVGRS